MADQQQQLEEDDDSISIFVYTGGQAPYNVRHVRVDESIDAIADEAFWNNPYLEYIEMHNRVGRIGYQAFRYCPALKGIKLPGVEIIEYGAFADCCGLEYVEFGNKLRTIEECAFFNCSSIEKVQFASPLRVGKYAFEDHLDAIERWHIRRSSSIWLRKVNSNQYYREYTQNNKLLESRELEERNLRRD